MAAGRVSASRYSARPDGDGLRPARLGRLAEGGDWSAEFGRGRGRPRPAPRMFESGELRLVLLKLIADQPRHGYDLIRAIEELTHGSYAPSPGVVYPTLTMLQDMGLIQEAAAEGARKAFAVTPEGEAHLAEQGRGGRGAVRAADRRRRRQAHAPAARRSSARSATCSRRSGTGSPPRTPTRRRCTRSPPSSTRRRRRSSG